MSHPSTYHLSWYLVEQFDTEKNCSSEIFIVSIWLLKLHLRTVFNYFLLVVLTDRNYFPLFWQLISDNENKILFTICCDFNRTNTYYSQIMISVSETISVGGFKTDLRDDFSRNGYNKFFVLSDNSPSFRTFFLLKYNDYRQ